MKIKIIFFSSILLLNFSVFILAQDKEKKVEFPDIKTFLSSLSGEKAKILFEAEGDLNNDSFKDWAGVITKRKPDKELFPDKGEVTITQLYVLLKNSRGNYVFAEKSKEGFLEDSSCCYVEDLQIKNLSVYLQVNSHTYGSVTANFYQFKLRKDHWQLIGFRTAKIFPFDEETGTDSSIETDRNLLTGNVIEETQIGERKPKIKRSKKKFSELMLKDFEFEYSNKNESSTNENMDH